MGTQKTISINQLLGQFFDLQEQWMEAPERFNWEALKTLALTGADFYNEGSGLSFQILATDGIDHGEFHLRFLEYSLEAGFDPFKLVRKGSGDAVVPAFAHESLADAAKRNPCSARMQARLQDAARARFNSTVQGEANDMGLALVIAYCRDSIPDDIAEKFGNLLLAA